MDPGRAFEVVLATDTRQWVDSIILQLVFHGEFTEEAAEFSLRASHPGEMHRLRESEDILVYHVSDFQWEAEEQRLALVVHGLALRLAFLGFGSWSFMF